MHSLYLDSIAAMRMDHRISRDHRHCLDAGSLSTFRQVGRSECIFYRSFFFFFFFFSFSSPPNCTRALLVCVDTARTSRDNTRQIDSCIFLSHLGLSFGNPDRSIIIDIRPIQETFDCISFLLSREYRAWNQI